MYLPVLSAVRLWGRAGVWRLSPGQCRIFRERGCSSSIHVGGFPPLWFFRVGTGRIVVRSRPIIWTKLFLKDATICNLRRSLCYPKSAMCLRCLMVWTAFGLRACQALERPVLHRSEEHTSELQSLMRISYAVF